MSGLLRSACGCWLATLATVAATGCSAGAEPAGAASEPTLKESVDSAQGALSSSCVTSCMASCFCDPDVKPTICRRQCQADCDEACACIPSCAGKACGASDGCGGVCSNGSCPSGQSCGGGGVVNQCGCTASCAGKACGASDGCGGVCSSGSCPSGQTCGGGGVANQCGCTASCAGKACGAADGCGGVCTNACPTPVPGLIDFDVTPTGSPITDATVVYTAYQSWGVTFSSIYCTSSGCNPAPAYARTRSGQNGSNGVSIFQSSWPAYFNAQYGVVEASFSQAQSTVSIDAIGSRAYESPGTPVARPFIEAYDAAGNMLTRTYYPAWGSPGFGAWQTLSVNAAGIRRVRFSSQAPGGTVPIYANFDNLQFH